MQSPPKLPVLQKSTARLDNTEVIPHYATQIGFFKQAKQKQKNMSKIEEDRPSNRQANLESPVN